MLFVRYLRLLEIAIAIAISVGFLPPLFAQIPSNPIRNEAHPDLSGGGRPDDRSGAAAQAVIFIEPPRNTPDLSSGGRPQTSGGGAASRGTLGNRKESIQLLIPRSNRGLTAEAHPTFWFRIDGSTDDVTEIEFVLADKDGNEIYYTFLEASEINPGIMGITLPSTVDPLEVDGEYQWSVFVYREELQQNRWASGFIQRKDPSLEVAGEIAAANSGREQAVIYARNGFWYDALTQLATLQHNGSGDPQDWRDLLSSEAVRLNSAIDKPILDCCRPE
ncbi:DUF928 domain-containing protein [Lusitaniella coriacea]|uniref:DUF928 domain-containing protein n=1 Tax=Lusitaniella coriacea TaxID=1983105 RepID=UPI003CEFE78B